MLHSHHVGRMGRTGKTAIIPTRGAFTYYSNMITPIASFVVGAFKALVGNVF